MSEYQYYEFCRLNAPLSQETRREMAALSSRARISTHGASYVYHYGNFRGNPKKLLLKHFDVFFYISNWGTVQLLFKYLQHEVHRDDIQKYCIRDVISCEQHDPYIVLDVHIQNEESSGWIEGEELLPDILPLYDEIKAGHYHFLQLASLIGAEDNSAAVILKPLSPAQTAFLHIVGAGELIS